MAGKHKVDARKRVEPKQPANKQSPIIIVDIGVPTPSLTAFYRPFLFVVWEALVSSLVASMVALAVLALIFGK